MALSNEQIKTIQWLTQRPAEFGQKLGFTKLDALHNEWMKEMIIKKAPDATLQAHRGSYKTTCLTVVLPIIVLCYPNDKTLFTRKTSADIQEIISQVNKILKNDLTGYLCRKIWDRDLAIITERVDQITTNLASADPRGTPQILAMGTQSSITGKHFDRIFTDDIVNLEDRASKAERDRVKRFYQELQNVKNRDGRIFNTGTPWHKDDAFAIMPPAKKYDCYNTGLMSEEDIAALKKGMTSSLFAANYELRHIAEDDVLFTDAQTDADAALAEQGIGHIDAAYGGADGTAFTIANKLDGKYYVLGKLYHRHIDDVEDEIIALHQAFNAGRISCEDNGDKGYLAKSLKQKGIKTHLYHENMNKYIKITTYLKGEWENVVFVAGTDAEYIQQVLDYNENAEHDDAPDSLASVIRELWRKKSPQNNASGYSLQNNFFA